MDIPTNGNDISTTDARHDSVAGQTVEIEPSESLDSLEAKEADSDLLNDAVDDAENEDRNL